MKVVRHIFLLVAFLFFSSTSVLFATPIIDDEDDDKPKKVQVLPQTAGSLKAALLYEDLGLTYSSSTFFKVKKKRSVGAAFGLSALVPGLGQVYNKQWGKAIVGFALEAAIITGAIVWNNQGLELESDYQQYAHTFWNPAKYAGWLNDYSTFLEANFDVMFQSSAIEIPSQIDFRSPENWSDMEWNVVLDFFSQIQAVEREMFHLETLAAFSHTLPNFSEQQYYELVGKYYQFAPGWEDYPEWKENGEFNTAIDPSMTGLNDTRPNVSPRFFQYADDHAHANDVLRRASRVTTLLIVTHFVAAIEAAVSTKLHNDRIKPSLEIGRSERGNPRAIASLRIRF